MNLFRLPLFITFLLLSTLTEARDVPSLSGPVVDEAGVLSYQMKRSLSASLANFYKVNGQQIQLLVIDELGDNETVEGFSIKVTDDWKLGKKGKDNGVLFLLSMKERKMRIEVGRGVEGDLTDLGSGRIIQLVRPYFKEGQYPVGIVVGLQAIANSLGGELTKVPLRSPRRRGKKRGAGYFIFLLIIVFIFGRGGGGRGGMGWLLLGGLMGSSSRSSGFGGGMSGGGGSSWGGGGGGFSGGGASGDW